MAQEEHMQLPLRLREVGLEPPSDRYSNGRICYNLEQDTGKKGWTVLNGWWAEAPEEHQTGKRLNRVSHLYYKHEEVPHGLLQGSRKD